MQINPAPLVFETEELQRQIEILATFDPVPEVDVDIVDWEFSYPPTITVPQALSVQHNLVMNFDLMMNHPEPFLEMLFMDQRVQRLLFNLKAVGGRLAELIEKTKSAGKQVGVSIIDRDDCERAIDYIIELDFIQIFTVTPGKQGNPFLRENLIFANYLLQNGFVGEIGVDGGVNQTTLPIVLEYPVDVVSVGSAISKAEHPHAAYQQLLQIDKDEV